MISGDEIEKLLLKKSLSFETKSNLYCYEKELYYSFLTILNSVICLYSGESTHEYVDARLQLWVTYDDGGHDIE